MNLTKNQSYVLEIINKNPGIQNDDIKLFEAVWISQGWDDTKSLYWNLSRVMHPESITRCRRKLHEYGLITYSDKALKSRTEAMVSSQEQHGTYHERMAEIVQPKPQYHLAYIDGEAVMVAS